MRGIWDYGKGQKYESFFWQDGYGAFSVSPNNIFVVKNYNKNQREHHKEFGFQTELINYFKKYNIEYDEKFLWD